MGECIIARRGGKSASVETGTGYPDVQVTLDFQPDIVIISAYYTDSGYYNKYSETNDSYGGIEHWHGYREVVGGGSIYNYGSALESDITINTSGFIVSTPSGVLNPDDYTFTYYAYKLNID